MIIWNRRISSSRSFSIRAVGYQELLVMLFKILLTDDRRCVSGGTGHVMVCTRRWYQTHSFDVRSARSMESVFVV